MENSKILTIYMVFCVVIIVVALFIKLMYVEDELTNITYKYLDERRCRKAQALKIKSLKTENSKIVYEMIDPCLLNLYKKTVHVMDW